MYVYICSYICIYMTHEYICIYIYMYEHMEYYWNFDIPVLIHVFQLYQSYFCALQMNTWEMECGQQWCLVNSGTYPQSDLWVTAIYDSWDVKVAETDETHRRGNYLHTALHHQRLCFLVDLGWDQNQDHPEIILNKK